MAVLPIGDGKGSYVFKDNANRYYDFREQIANHWHVGFQEVLIFHAFFVSLQPVSKNFKKKKR